MAASKSHDSDDDEIENLQFKVILLGDGAVGKTSIAMRFAEDQFSQAYKQTVGVDFFIRRLNVPPKFQVALQIWDIGENYISFTYPLPTFQRFFLFRWPIDRE